MALGFYKFSMFCALVHIYITMFPFYDDAVLCLCYWLLGCYSIWIELTSRKKGIEAWFSLLLFLIPLYFTQFIFYSVKLACLLIFSWIVTWSLWCFAFKSWCGFLRKDSKAFSVVFFSCNWSWFCSLISYLSFALIDCEAINSL